ncbi:MAG: hypothetical protein FWC32_10505 [Firmicutes bacterium]|nr:hypothetical protein [Bacillota bacterium]
MRHILLTLCAFALVLLAPTAVYASQTSRTLQPGNVYEFTGIDARVISHVNVTGTGRYDIVAWDAEGEITRFGTGSGRFSVSGRGGVAVTPLAPLSVSFDSSRIRLSSRAGSALRRVNIPVGQTVNFANNHSANLHIRTHQLSSFDYAVFNRAGHSTDFAREVRLPQISIPFGGSITVTAALRETSVYFPSRLANYIDIENLAQPAIHTIDLLAGQAYTLSNTSDRSYTLRIEPPVTGSTFAFEYITRGRDGHVTSHGERDTNQIQLGSRHSITITPILDGEMFFPSAWLEYIRVGYGTVAPIYQTLQSGSSLIITNNDTHRPHSVFIRCPEEEYGFTIEYVTLLNDDATFGIREIAPGDSMTLTLQAGAQTTVTIAESETLLTISFPDIDEITSQPAAAGALARYILEPGQGSLTLYNSHPHSSYTVSISSSDITQGFTIDYSTVLDDQVTFNTIEAVPRRTVNLTLQSGAEITITAVEAAEQLIVRFAGIEEITATSGDSVAVVRHVLQPGQSVYVSYTGEDSVGVLTFVERGVRDAALDFVRYYDGDIDTFGTVDVGSSIIFAEGESAIITNSGDDEITLQIPKFYLENGLELQESDSPALFRLNVTWPTQIENRSRHYVNSFNLQNETRRSVRQGANVLEYVIYSTGNNISAFGQRGLGTIEIPANQRMVVAPVPNGITPSIIFPAEWYGVHFRISRAQETPLHRITLTPGRSLTIYNNTRHEFVIQNNAATTAAGFVFGRVRNVTDANPLNHAIQIAPRTDVTITATNGADLELWLPARWARQLRFSTR